MVYTAALPRVSAGSVVLSRHVTKDKSLWRKYFAKKHILKKWAFTAKILSWRFRHLNIAGCSLKRRPNKGGSRAPQNPPPPPSYAPGVSAHETRSTSLLYCSTMQQTIYKRFLLYFFHLAQVPASAAFEPPMSLYIDIFSLESFVIKRLKFEGLISCAIS